MSAQLTSTNTNVERIIAKIDNDFNPDNSDWIPRVGAWCMDAMSMIDCVPTERKKMVLEVHERIAYSPCQISDKNLKVYDSNGCEIEEADSSRRCGCNSSTGGTKGGATAERSMTTSAYRNDSPAKAPDYLIAETLNASKSWPGRYRINEYRYGLHPVDRNYVVSGCNQIELNFDTDCITIEYDAVKTTISNSYGCEVPVIPNNGLLIEALTYYCMYKCLCRGMKHPVMNLQASQFGTNPYYMWNELKEQARRSILAGETSSDDDITRLFRSGMYIFDYDPRR